MEGRVSISLVSQEQQHCSVIGHVCMCNRVNDDDQGSCIQALFYLAMVEEYGLHPGLFCPKTLSYFP